MESLKEMWQLVCEQLKSSCGEVIYDIWFRPLEIIRFDGSKAEIAASEFMKKIIEQKFIGDIKEAFKSVMGFDVDDHYKGFAQPPGSDRNCIWGWDCSEEITMSNLSMCTYCTNIIYNNYNRFS